MIRGVLDSKEVARRVKAARAFAGFTSTKKLADAINSAGLRVGTLRKYEEARRKPIRRRELFAIAEACDLPLDWFYADLSRLHEIVPVRTPAPDPGEALELELEEAAGQAGEHGGSSEADEAAPGAQGQ